MKEKDDGGYVYACTDTDMRDIQTGITRRDWLAGLAMQGLLSNDEAVSSLKKMVVNANSTLGEELSGLSYQLADAMIVKGDK